MTALSSPRSHQCLELWREEAKERQREQELRLHLGHTPTCPRASDTAPFATEVEAEDPSHAQLRMAVREGGGAESVLEHAIYHFIVSTLRQWTVSVKQ